MFHSHKDNNQRIILRLYFLLRYLSFSSPTTSGSSVTASPSIASTSSSVGSSVGGTTVTTDSSGSFSIVKSPETLISETE